MNEAEELAKALHFQNQRNIESNPLMTAANAIAKIKHLYDETGENPSKQMDQRIIARYVRQLHEDAPRYEYEKLSTFQVTFKEQKSVVERLRKICQEIKRFVEERHQLFLWGPIGTGKDHLAVSVLRAAAMAGYSVRWREGLQVYEEVAGAFQDEKTHTEIYQRYTKPDVLCISDPVFVKNWSQAKEEALRKIIRRRYNEFKPTWVTVNLTNLSKADEMFGADTYDRLSEKSCRVQCAWKSRRETVKSEF